MKKELETLRQRGFFRLLALPTEAQARKGQAETIIDLNSLPRRVGETPTVRTARDRLLVLVDRLAIKKEDEANQSRIADSVEQAFREGGGRCVIVPAHPPGDGRVTARPDPLHFSEHFEKDGLIFEEPTTHLFSFNSPVGACPTCQGFGRVPGLDEDLVIPNTDLSIRQGAIAPFRTEQWSKFFRELIRLAADERIDIDLP